MSWLVMLLEARRGAAGVHRRQHRATIHGAAGVAEWHRAVDRTLGLADTERDPVGAPSR
jgi:hypothetical protein